MVGTGFCMCLRRSVRIQDLDEFMSVLKQLRIKIGALDMRPEY